MRTFIAIDLPIEAKNEIMRIQKILWKKTLFSGKLTESENLHLTLKFLGEIDDDKIEEVKTRLSLTRFNEFFAETGEIGVFSPDFTEKQGFSVPKNLQSKQRFSGIKIIWMKLNGKGVFNLQKEIDDRLADLFPPEVRFMSHITIARVKNVSDKRGFLDYLKSVKPKKVKFLVKEFELKKSELKDIGAVYSSIKSYNSFEEKI